MKVIILAAGRGERLKPLTDHTPKPLTLVQGKPLLAHHFTQLEKAQFKEIVINVSWLKQQIINYANKQVPNAVSVVISDEGNQALETGGGMLKALPLLEHSPFLAVNADVYTDFDFCSLPKLDPGIWVHLVLVKNPEHNPNGDFSLSHNKLQLKQNNETSYTYSGIGIFHPDLFQGQVLGSAFSVTPLIKQAIAENRATGQVHAGTWSDVGSIERLNELNAKEC